MSQTAFLTLNELDRVRHVFVIGDANKPSISLPKAKGIKLSVLEQREQVAGKKE